MIKAVILDFGGVVFKNKPKEEWAGLKTTFNIDPEIWLKATLGQVSDEEVFELVAKNHQVQPEEVQEWLFSRREPNKELLDLLANLKPEIKKAIINNGLKTLFRGFLQKYNLSIDFDVVVNSAEEGIRKPDPEIYFRVCKRLGVEPSECVFIDDDEVYLKGATDLGMKGIFYTNPRDLEREFKDLSLFKI